MFSDSVPVSGVSSESSGAVASQALSNPHYGPRGLKLLHRLGGYVFVHAGLRPGVPMEAQTRQDMLWIREPFLSSDAGLGAVAVHGHTAEENQPVVRANRIGMDTGAVLGGMLSCVVLEGETMGFLQA